MHQLLVINLIDYYRNLKSKIAFSSLHFYHTSPEGKEDEIETLTINNNNNKDFILRG